MGFVLLITVLDKHRSAGVGGVSQRLEKEGLKRGLYSLDTAGHPEGYLRMTRTNDTS
jgi:hypothetical protein